jgi:hypothetical protein
MICIWRASRQLGFTRLARLRSTYAVSRIAGGSFTIRKGGIRCHAEKRRSGQCKWGEKERISRRAAALREILSFSLRYMSYSDAVIAS